MKRELFFISVLLTVLFFSSCGNAAEKGKNKNDVTIGVITYSFRSMPDQSVPAILDYCVRSGVTSVELMGDVVEDYFGKPGSKDPEEVKQWRLSLPMSKYEEVKKMFDEKGIKINILKLGDSKWSDEEIDYAFAACKTVDAKGLSMEISEEAGKRMAPFAEKHDLYVIFHNHGQPGSPDFSFDKVLEISPRLMLNLDAGHYFGATGKDPCELISRLHDRIISIHIKDKTGPNSTPRDTNQEFGKGETPVVEILQLVKKNGWPVSCDIELEYNIPEGSDAVAEVSKCVRYCKDAIN